MNRDQQHKFDEQIRKELSDLQPDYAPQSWDKLSELLSDPPAEPAQAAADEQLRTSLNDLTPAYRPESWELLNAKIDQRNNAAADGIIVDRLDRTAAPAYRAGSWALLAARLELIAQRRSCLTALKITEFSLLLSALLLFWNFFPTGGFYAPVQPAILAENTFGPLNQQQSDQASSAAEFSQLTNPALATKQQINVSTSANTTATTGRLANQETQLTLRNQSTYELELSPRNEQSKRTVKVIQPLAMNSSPLVESTQHLALTVNTEKATPPLAGVEFTPESRKNIAWPAVMWPGKAKREAQQSVRVFVSPWDFNRVVTPAFAVREKQIERDVRLSYGLSAGVLLENDLGKNGHSYGLVYGRRSYVPTVFANVEGRSEDVRPSPLQPRDTNYSRIIFHTVGVPLNYQRELFGNGRWRLTASVGLEANVVLSSKFYKSPNFDENINNYLRSTSPIAVARSGEFNTLSKEDLTDPEKGLLQGGSALRNSSLYFSVGFSLERQLSESTSVFFAPQFSRALYYRRDTGLGPFDDRIHPNAVRFGARYRLGE